MTGTLTILDRTGDSQVEWNTENADEVSVARETFEKFIQKGYMAYKVLSGGQRGSQIRTFDPTAERIVFVPAMQGG